MKYCGHIKDVLSNGKINLFNEVIINTLKDVEKIQECKDIDETTTLIFLSDSMKDIYNMVEKNPMDNIIFAFSQQNEYKTELIELLKTHNKRFMYSNMALTFTELKNWCEDGVSAAVIGGDLLSFRLNKVRDIKNKFHIEIKMYNDVIPTSMSFDNNKNSYYSFFIRPEDIFVIEKYIDTIMFDIERDGNLLFKIYNRGSWLGDLRPLINNLDLELHSNFMPPTFAVDRAECGKRCCLGEKCNICANVLSLSEALQNSQLEIRVEKVRK